MLTAFMHTVNTVCDDGIIKDERMDEELAAGRRGIIRPLTTGNVREVALGGPGSDGVLSVTVALEKIAGATRRIYRDDPALAEMLVKALKSDLGPSLVYHEERSRKAREVAASAIKPGEETVSEGEILARQGEKIGPTEHEKLLREAEVYYSTLPLGIQMLRVGGVVLMVAGIVLLLMWTSTTLEPGVLASTRTLFLVWVVDLLVVGAGRALIVAGLPVILSPVVLATIMLALAVSRTFAVMNAVALSFLVALAAGPDFAATVPLTVGAAIGSLIAARSSRRSELIRSGALAGVAMCVAVAGVDLVIGFEGLNIILTHGGWALMSGVLSGLLSIGLLPLFEVAFGMTTDISLLELSDQNHPALRRLLLEAPGTYHHSLIVGNLSEAGALAIGANALLARVASYYHDLGKVDRPEYFIENEAPGRSRHEGLSPTMSTLIITSHVRDGAALATSHRLPKTITDIITQHHGTTLVEFFYRAAMDRAAGEPVDKQLFRYPGPKPQSREAGIVLLADSVEAASRSLGEPTSSRLSKLVQELMQKRLLDGQFDESGLTLKDLRTLNQRFVKVLSSMFHSRVPYPGGSGGSTGS
jgi:putative nucleotidyltransferase with HDIG domain